MKSKEAAKEISGRNFGVDVDAWKAGATRKNCSLRKKPKKGSLANFGGKILESLFLILNFSNWNHEIIVPDFVNERDCKKNRQLTSRRLGLASIAAIIIGPKQVLTGNSSRSLSTAVLVVLVTHRKGRGGH